MACLNIGRGSHCHCRFCVDARSSKAALTVHAASNRHRSTCRERNCAWHRLHLLQPRLSAWRAATSVACAASSTSTVSNLPTILPKERRPVLERVVKTISASCIRLASRLSRICNPSTTASHVALHSNSICCATLSRAVPLSSLKRRIAFPPAYAAQICQQQSPFQVSNDHKKPFRSMIIDPDSQGYHRQFIIFQLE